MHIIIQFLKTCDKEKILKQPEKINIYVNNNKNNRRKYHRLLIRNNANQKTVNQYLQGAEKKKKNSY